MYVSTLITHLGSENKNMKNIIVNFDGACGPQNPGGKCGGGAVVRVDKDKKLLVDRYMPADGEVTTNNMAEYHGLLLAMKHLIDNDLHREKILFLGDSLMVIRQMRGEYGISYDKPYSKKAREAQALIKQFPYVSFQHVRRELNQEADDLSKLAIEF